MPFEEGNHIKTPNKWFEKALNSGKYKKEVIAKIKTYISGNNFNVDEFMNWVSEKLENN